MTGLINKEQFEEFHSKVVGFREQVHDAKADREEDYRRVNIKLIIDDEEFPKNKIIIDNKDEGFESFDNFLNFLRKKNFDSEAKYLMENLHQGGVFYSGTTSISYMLSNLGLLANRVNEKTGLLDNGVGKKLEIKLVKGSNSMFVTERTFFKGLEISPLKERFIVSPDEKTRVVDSKEYNYLTLLSLAIQKQLNAHCQKTLIGSEKDRTCYDFPFTFEVKYEVKFSLDGNPSLPRVCDITTEQPDLKLSDLISDQPDLKLSDLISDQPDLKLSEPRVCDITTEQPDLKVLNSTASQNDRINPLEQVFNALVKLFVWFMEKIIATKLNDLNEEPTPPGKQPNVQAFDDDTAQNNTRMAP